MKKEIKKSKIIILYILTILIITILSLRYYLLTNFKLVTFEQLLYSTINTEGASTSSIVEGVIFVGSSVFIGLVIFTIYLIINNKCKNITYINILIKNKKRKIQIFPLKNKIKIYIFILICSILFFLSSIGLFQYLKNKFDNSLFYEENYIDPKDVKITFPKEKRNLIYIFLESLENSSLSKENGGTVEESYIPELEELALNNINFSNTEKLGGAIPTSNTGWTIAALIAQTSGVTLNTMNINGNSYGGFSKFLPGATTIGDILSDEGYINYFMIGSDADFGGRKHYFSQHGHYYIYDYNTAIEKQKIKDYYVWWGYEDKKLFEYAKEELLKLSDGEQPFNFTLLTVDTHFTDGYLDETCETPFDSQYANVFNCSNNMVSNFISWIKEQDFYENTTIVLAGDHLTMQSDFFEEEDNYQRTTFNTIINSSIDAENTKNRTFSTLDMFPTTLASLGVEIEGDRLGLGTNLFSNKKTLFEEYGVEYVNNELLKNSEYYNNILLGNSYYEILQQTKNTK